MIKRMFAVLFKEPVSIHGRWIEEEAGLTGINRGFILLPDGNAVSINMATLIYDTWWLNDNILTLKGKSFWGNCAIEFSETMRIKELTNTRMVLLRAGEFCIYSRL